MQGYQSCRCVLAWEHLYTIVLVRRPVFFYEVLLEFNSIVLRSRTRQANHAMCQSHDRIEFRDER